MDISQEKEIIDKQVKIIVDKILKKTDCFKICRFHLSELPESDNWENHSSKDSVFTKHVDVLKNYKGDCLYWFNCDTVEEALKLDNALANYRNGKKKKGYRAVPTSNKYIGKDKTIYVGVRRGTTAKKPKVSNVLGRINQHLGYYKQPKTQGLQLLHWARELDVNISIYVVHFENKLGALLYVLEKEVSKRLIPHCGRH